MADFDTKGYARAGTVRTDAGLIDEGLRAYMLRVYNYMAMGLAITGVVAYAFFLLSTQYGSPVAQLPNGTSITEFGRLIFVSPLKWVIMLAPLGAVFLLSARIGKMSVSGAQMAFWVFAALMGASLSSIFLVYAHGAPGINEAMRQIDELSRRVVGGPGLIRFAYGDDDRTLWYWQVRNYPNAVFYGDQLSQGSRDAPVVIAGRDQWEMVTPYLDRDYEYNTYNVYQGYDRQRRQA